MAVYTVVSAEDLGGFLERYDLGRLVSAKGIAEGVENSNYLVETTAGRFILTLYEKRVDETDLPYFLGLMAHVADKGLPVPRPIVDRRGEALQTLNGRRACLIEFLPGVSLTEPTPAHCKAAGEVLGRLHAAAADFGDYRENRLSIEGWHRLTAACAGRWGEIDPALDGLVAEALDWLAARWPLHLATSAIHADLFPDNVLIDGVEVSGLIDFYFACNDIRAYDVAVTHGSWCFSNDGGQFFADRSAALLNGYEAGHGLTDEERAALPILCRGASLRFLLTRAYDWINTPPDALVTRKSPMAYARRLLHYRSWP